MDLVTATRAGGYALQKLGEGFDKATLVWSQMWIDQFEACCGAGTLHGKPAAVVVSVDEYARLTRPRRGKLSAALLRPDIAGDDLDLSRSRDTGREIQL